ncbi:hypothetical protein N5U04_04250 [Aliarcobacter butzleri]|uniref:hypothetical protein n=1 Tax=Aliarcobacter butzleri TaxID=28197 RepID=UPI0021B38853|nr:hypothetical protein [Aliarcobacter butzleri]MCT7549683.1 hypothetical protein [Aliarcobacter butzleri]MCT7558784.1 hypothetical protein [Aliarcobacter butzleri]
MIDNFVEWEKKNNLLIGLKKISNNIDEIDSKKIEEYKNLNLEHFEDFKKNIIVYKNMFLDIENKLNTNKINIEEVEALKETLKLIKILIDDEYSSYCHNKFIGDDINILSNDKKDINNIYNKIKQNLDLFCYQIC